MLEYVSDLELKEITALRLEGESPSKIARRLEMRPALVREVIRRLAREQSSTSIYQTEDDPCLDQPPLYKCFINANWTRGLSGTEVDSFRSNHSLPPGEENSLDGGLIHIL